MDNRYTLTDRIGGGGMAEVYLARDAVLERDVAVKILRGQFSHDDEFVERFRREARSAAALSHPNIVQVYDQGRAEDGTYYMAIEYVPGGTLKERIVEQGALDPAEAVGIAGKVTEALSVAHDRGIIHRDIKPQNVLMTPRGEAKVADFGIARAASATVVTQTNLVLGTAGYMSPEQAIGERVEPTSDLYSLGVVLYEMLTGSLPYEADTPIGVAMQHINAPPQSPRDANPEVPEDLDAVTLRLLSKDPADRYPSADALARDLERIKNGLPVSTAPRATSETRVAPVSAPVQPTRSRPTSAGRTTRRRRGRGLMPVFLALVAGLLLLAGVAWALSSGMLGGGKEVKVPGVEGKPLEEARGTLEGKGFEVGVNREESSVEQDGIVLGQSVKGGQTANEGDTIDLTVGKKPATVAIPNIPYEATEDEARSQLEDAGLELGEVSKAYSNEYVVDGVVSQNPLPDVQVDPGSTVDITLSAGPAPAPEPIPEPTTEPEPSVPVEETPAPAQESAPQNEEPAPIEETPPVEQEPSKTPKQPEPALTEDPGKEAAKEARQEAREAGKEAQEDAGD